MPGARLSHGEERLSVASLQEQEYYNFMHVFALTMSIVSGIVWYASTLRHD